MKFRDEPAAAFSEELVVEVTPVAPGVAAGVEEEGGGLAVPFPGLARTGDLHGVSSPVRFRGGCAVVERIRKGEIGGGRKEMAAVMNSEGERRLGRTLGVPLSRGGEGSSVW